MRIAKTLAVLFALVLVVVCFNAPAVYSGEEHPWDEDGSLLGDGEHNIGPNGDSIVTVTAVNSPGTGHSGGGVGSQNGSYRLWIAFQFIFWYRDVPRFGLEHTGVAVSDWKKNEVMTSIKAR
jgi:hypothetical protein